MAKQVPWNEVIYLEFSKLAMLSDLEKEVLRTRIMGYSITKQAILFNCSESTINRMIATLKKKYDVAQAHSDKLPPRKTSKEETWMDEN